MSLLTPLLLALAVAANPVLIPKSSAKALKARGLAKANGLSIDAVINEQIDNQVVSYNASVGVGSPATTYDLIIDIRSSNTWVGVGKLYVRTSTSVQTSNRVSVNYGDGSFSGTEFTDQVTIAPVHLKGTLSPAILSTVPTVTDNLFSGELITSNEIGISFEPTTTAESLNGELTWGGTDSSKFTGSIGFTPITGTSPANQYWGINQSIRYSTFTSILATTAGIIDSRTTLILIATDGFNSYVRATGAVNDPFTGLLSLTRFQFENLQSLFFTTNGITYELTANAQIWPRSLNTAIGGNADSVYLIIADFGSPSGEGFDFVNGFAFLERFYSVFDTTNKRVGFATTLFTHATTN
ncbi:aspartic proteinase from Irpex Lacteus [Crucibulum laeve]|uniref:Aspartic proteinase from Irpex Lacteus n=1 Tax=Crucibulum laeve TaxID=68775 RepID=A0A5C3LUB3_9AGAR|nr:aspartic proteinase from Irpex Lacteus [Crucibulum laeve]